MDGASVLQLLVGIMLVFMIALGVNLSAPVLVWSAAALLVLLLVMAAVNARDSKG